MPHTLLRFLAALVLLVWLGFVISSFTVARELFSGRIEAVPNSAVAGEIMSPILRKMHVTAWIAAPACAALILILARKTARRPVVVALSLLAFAFGLSIYTGSILDRRLGEIRLDLKRDFGGYDKAPKTEPRRAEFGRLHGVSMVLTLAELLAGLGAFFIVTQKLQPASSRIDGAEKTV